MALYGFNIILIDSDAQRRDCGLLSSCALGEMERRVFGQGAEGGATSITPGV